MTTKVYLSGGGNSEQSFLFDRFFLDEIPRGSCFLYVPLALRRSNLYLGAEKWLKGVLRLHEREGLLLETANDLRKYTNLKKYSCIYIGGGNTWDLIAELEGTGYCDKLTDYHAHGGTIYGGSAGAIILGKRIDTQSDKNFINFKKISGIDMLSGYSVACHYVDDQCEHFRDWAVQHKSPIICLPEESGVVVEDDLVTCVGSASCVIFSPDGDGREIEPMKYFRA